MSFSNHFDVRRAILNVLYDQYRQSPGFSGGLSYKQVVDRASFPPKDINWNAKYLEDSSFVSLEPDCTGGEAIFTFAHITHLGINLVESPSEFNSRFPQVTQNVTIHGSHAGHIQGAGVIRGAAVLSILQDRLVREVQSDISLSEEDKSSALERITGFFNHPVIVAILARLPDLLD